MFVDGARAVAFRYALKLCDRPPARLRLGKRKMNCLLFLRNLDALDLLQLFNTALHLLRLSRGIPKAVDKYFQLLDALALGLVRRLQLLFARRFRRQILVVISGIKMHLLVPDFNDALNSDVEKISVV